MVISVALYTSAWIEIGRYQLELRDIPVALYTSAWIEIKSQRVDTAAAVALYTSAWIEITHVQPP